MKRPFKNKIFKAPVAVIAVTCLLFIFSSCLKNNQYYYDLKDVGASIDMPLAAFNTNAVFALPLDVADTPTTYPVFVNVASPQVLGKSVTATLGLDTAYLDQYNVANGTSYEVLPDSDYSVSSWDLTVPAKQRLANVIVKIYTIKIDASHNYVLPLTITKASLPIENWNHLLINVTAKNAYDGIYVLTGYAQHPTSASLTGPFGPVDVNLITSGQYSVAMDQQPWSTASGSGLPSSYFPNLTVDPSTNNVTITNAQFGSTVLNSPGYNSHYDPSSKTIYAGWQYNGSSGTRVFRDTLVYKGPR